MTQAGQAEIALGGWDPQRALRKIDPAEVRYSRGFLRCRPEKWFPGCATPVLPRAHSLGVGDGIGKRDQRHIREGGARRLVEQAVELFAPDALAVGVEHVVFGETDFSCEAARAFTGQHDVR